jgi:hypothetical protein
MRQRPLRLPDGAFFVAEQGSRLPYDQIATAIAAQSSWLLTTG